MGAELGEPLELGKLHPAFHNKYQRLILEEQEKIEAEEKAREKEETKTRSKAEAAEKQRLKEEKL